MNLEFWLLYVSVVFMASIIPGPSMLLALTHGIKYGYKRSIVTALGNTTASIIQAIIAISGLSIIFTTSGILFEVIRYAGAIYLIYIGIMLFKTPSKDMLSTNDIDTNSSSIYSMFSQAFFIAIGNPKAIIFFTALFPQFISSDGTPLFQYILMTTALGVIAFVCMMIYSIAGAKATTFLRTSIIGKYLNKITGGIFVSAGCAVAFKP
jgi:threonine/homoserine/homoserine lactone efflux protein